MKTENKMENSKFTQENSSYDHTNNDINHDAALLPHLESFEKMLKLPVVEAAWHQSQGVYGRVKGKFSLIFSFSFFVQN